MGFIVLLTEAYRGVMRTPVVDNNIDMEDFLEIATKAVFEAPDGDAKCNVNIACKDNKAKYMLNAHSSCALAGDETAKLCCEDCLSFDTFHEVVIKSNGEIEKIDR